MMLSTIKGVFLCITLTSLNLGSAEVLLDEVMQVFNDEVGTPSSTFVFEYRLFKDLSYQEAYFSVIFPPDFTVDSSLVSCKNLSNFETGSCSFPAA